MIVHNRPASETVRLGKEIYERDIRHLVEADHHGQVVAIDIDSGSYALDENAIDASERLRAHHPDTEVWLMRVRQRFRLPNLSQLCYNPNIQTRPATDN